MIGRKLEVVRRVSCKFCFCLEAALTDRAALMNAPLGQCLCMLL